MGIKISFYQPGFNTYFDLPNSDFTGYIMESIELLDKYPEILKRIEADQEIRSKSKKQMRLEDKAWEKAGNQVLPEIIMAGSRNNINNVQMEEGRPRKMTPMATYIFIMVRGYCGGIKSELTTIFTEESLTLKLILQQYGMQMPGRSTIGENINAISNLTREYIMDCQFKAIIDEGMDDYKKLTIDSTSVEGNTCYPKESELLYFLTERIYLRGQKLSLFGIANIKEGKFKRIIKDLHRLSAKINMGCGKPGSEKKRRKLYRNIYKLVDFAITYYEPEIKRITEELITISITPSQYHKLTRMVDLLQKDLENLKKVRKYSYQRVIEEQKIAGKEKIASHSDKDADFIVKGLRDLVIGYKPQLVKTDKGFIAGLELPQGNAADSDRFEDSIKKAIQRTTVIPDVISADDGYVNTKARNAFLELNVKIVSFSGSKGKRLIPESEWNSEEYQDARNQRSAVESLMFTIKNGFDFGRVARRGLENVRAELLEKVIAYNFCRIIQVRKKQSELKAA